MSKKVQYVKTIKQYSILVTDINPVYTSQVCNPTGVFGHRKGELFYLDNCQEGVYSGYNSAGNIKDRRDDPQITLETPPHRVKAILQKRLSDSQQGQTQNIGNVHGDEPCQPRPCERSESSETTELIQSNV